MRQKWALEIFLAFLLAWWQEGRGKQLLKEWIDLLLERMRCSHYYSFFSVLKVTFIAFFKLDWLCLNCLQRTEIKAYAASLITQISDVLQRMPRPLLMILKTNDLLRSIEYRLGTHNRADAFIQVCLLILSCISSIW